MTVELICQSLASKIQSYSNKQPKNCQKNSFTYTLLAAQKGFAEPRCAHAVLRDIHAEERPQAFLGPVVDGVHGEGDGNRCVIVGDLLQQLIRGVPLGGLPDDLLDFLEFAELAPHHA